MRHEEPAAAPMTTLIAPVPFAESVVGALRRRHDWSARRGVPAHVTVLGPFLAPDEITRGTIDVLGAIVARHAPIAVSLDRLVLLGGHAACLVPDGMRDLARLAADVHRGWPTLPSMRDTFHVTVARGCDPAEFARLRRRVVPALPLGGVITELLLLHRYGSGAVELRERFALGSV